MKIAKERGRSSTTSRTQVRHRRYPTSTSTGVGAEDGKVRPGCSPTPTPTAHAGGLEATARRGHEHGSGVGKIGRVYYPAPYADQRQPRVLRTRTRSATRRSSTPTPRPRSTWAGPVADAVLQGHRHRVTSTGRDLPGAGIKTSTTSAWQAGARGHRGRGLRELHALSSLRGLARRRRAVSSEEARPSASAGECGAGQEVSSSGGERPGSRRAGCSGGACSPAASGPRCAGRR